MMKIVFMGTPDFAVNVLQGLIDNYDVVGVVSQPDKRIGRHQVLTNTPVKELALKYDIPVFQPIRIREDYEDILNLNPDLIVTCAYGQIIPKDILDYPRLGCINVHASLLPKLRGGAPIHKAIIDDYGTTGVTIMYMDVKMDSGDIISQREVKILDSDNLESLHDKLSEVGTSLLLDTLPSIIDGSNSSTKQDEDEVTYAYNIKREEEHIDFSKTSREVFNLIRGLCPVPSSNAILDEKEMKIYKSIISSKNYNGEYGEIVDITKEGIVVKTGDAAIILTEVKPFGKKKMDANSYVNGIGKNNLIGKVFK
ncbi:MAG: methionyl-tRNA formyltransferase [Mollicutes bacterium]|nr:methionyl-tRNA formyltransferase [Mollicutes bacterium]